MHQSCRSTVRVSAAVGTVVAMITVSSAFGVGAAAAVAADTTTTTNPSATPTSEPTAGAAPGTTVVSGGTTVPSEGTTVVSEATTAPSQPTTEPPGGTEALPAADATPAPTEGPSAVPTPEPTTGTPSGDTPAATSPSSPSPAPTTAPAPAAAPAQPVEQDATPAATAAGSVTIDGTATTWHTLRAVTAGWPADTTFSYRWSIGTRVVDGATSDTYVLDERDVSHDLTVTVTGTAPGAAPTTVTSTAVTVAANDESTFTTGIRELDVAAGDAVSIPIQALPGDQDGLRYGVSRTADGPVDAAALPAGLTLSSDGVLSGSTTDAQLVDFWVLTRTTQQPDGAAGQHVQLRVGLAADTSIEALVDAYDPPHSRVWWVGADGTSHYVNELSDDPADPSTPITSTVGKGITVNAGRVDRYGNREAYAVIDNDWSSSVASDVLGKYDPGTGVTFSEPGDRVLSGTAVDGRTISFTVHVDPAGTAVVPPTPITPTTPSTPTEADGTGTPGNGTTAPGQLAFTGADESGSIAWALGLLAAGAAVLVVRLRRRRA